MWGRYGNIKIVENKIFVKYQILPLASLILQGIAEKA